MTIVNFISKFTLLALCVQLGACALTESYPEESARKGQFIAAYNQEQARFQPSRDFKPAQEVLQSRKDHAVRVETFSRPAEPDLRSDYPELSDKEIIEARAQLQTLGMKNDKMATVQYARLDPTALTTAPEISKRAKGDVAPGYLVQIVALEDEKLNGRFRVNFNGNLKLPYGVSIDTTGQSEKEMSESITKAYRKYFRTDPSLQITIVERDLWVDVRGLVKESGKFLVKEDTSVDELLAKAGGLERDQAGNALAQFVRINQLGTDTALIELDDYYAGNAFDIPQWQGGDTVFAQTRKPQLEDDARAQFGGNASGVSSNHIQLVGQVKYPGKFVYKEDADFFYYLVQAGGPTEQADLNRLFIVREQNGEKVNTRVDLETLDNLPQIQAGDLLILNGDVPGASEKGLDFLGSVSEIITSIASVALLAFAL
ncbi:MAG: SLBB domain-containing protein [Bdellovibrionales bacterium]|nr:SLBB domain-containing protein [Bdellovibrionales bacterium]